MLCCFVLTGCSDPAEVESSDRTINEPSEPGEQSTAEVLAPSAPEHNDPITAIKFHAKGEGPKVLVFGDSLSSGYGLADQQGWVDLFRQRLITDTPGWQVINASIAGETTSQGVRKLPAALARENPDWVFLELGGNDALRGTDLTLTESNLREMIELSRDAGADVLLFGMQVPPNYGPVYSEQFAELFFTLAEEEGTALIPFFLEGVAEQRNYFQPDQIHPNAAAQPIMMENVWSVFADEAEL